MKSTGLVKRLRVEVGGGSLISTAGGALLVETARATGLARGLSRGLRGFRSDRATHDPGKVVLDLAVAIAVGGDCLADIGVVRAQPDLFGPVASDPTVSRLIGLLAADADAALAAISGARAAARAVAWSHRSPCDAAGPVIVDLDATLVTAHSEKEDAAPTFKGGYGHHPLLSFADHGPGGTGSGGEPLAVLLRRGNAAANDGADHVTVIDAALAQLPAQVRPRVLIRADGGGGTKKTLSHVHALGLRYSVGISAMIGVDRDLLDQVPDGAWTPAYDADRQPREGADIADLTGMLGDLTARGWPPGMRVIARRERPHPGAQLRVTDADGWRITLFATNSRVGQLADLDLRHRRRARAEDRIRCLKDSGLRNLPLQKMDANRIWLELTALAADLLTWTQTLALTRHRRAEPKRVRLRILSVAAQLIRTGRRTVLRLPADWPWAQEITDAHQRLRALPAP